MTGVIEDLQALDMAGALQESRIKDGLKSYDILQNPDYSRLSEYARIFKDSDSTS
jgi:hypothetical protein